MHLGTLFVYATVLATCVIFAHFLDNIRNRRTESSKYYYKRGLSLACFIAFITFIMDTHFGSSTRSHLQSHNMVGNGVYGIQTGTAPF